MLIVYLDTNAIYADLLMERDTSADLLEQLAQGEVEVALSPVVVGEAQRRAEEAAERVIGDAEAALDSVVRAYPSTEETADGLLNGVTDIVRAAGKRALAPLIAHAACHVTEWPAVSSQELVERELARRLPSQLKGDQSIGLRDTIIWHGLVEVLENHDEDHNVLFVTADKAFVDDGKLAPSLVKELKDAGHLPERVRVQTRLENAVVEVERYRHVLNAREAFIRQAAIDYLAGFVGKAWASIDSGGNAPVLLGFEKAVVSAVDDIRIEPFEAGVTATVLASTEVTISGAMRIEEYLEEFSEVVEWQYGDPGDGMISVDYTAPIEVEMEIEVEQDGEEAWVNDAMFAWGRH